MTAPNRRQLMAGSIAALGAAGAPTIAVAATPDERIELALQELRRALDARWPGQEIAEGIHLEMTKPTMWFIVQPWTKP